MTFGPRLIGETEKALSAILEHALGGTGLTQPLWVGLRLAQQAPADLAAAIGEQARFATAPGLVAELTARGLVLAGRLTSAGEQVVARVQARIEQLSAPVFADLPAPDVAAATRVLTTVRDRARSVSR